MREKTQLHFKENKLLTIFIAFIVSSIFLSTAFAGSPSRVLILPFTIHSQEDLTYLQKGIYDMLSVRLAQEGKVAVISSDEAGEAIAKVSGAACEKTAIELGTRFNADYVTLGSLTVFGDSISTDAKFLDVHSKNALVIYNQPGTSHGDVIFHINNFAMQINQEVFGRKTAVYKPTTQPSVNQPVQKEAMPESRKKPDTILTEERSKKPLFSEGAHKREVDKYATMWKSSKFKVHIKGIAVGDVDGDGKNETVLIANQKVLIYKYSKGKFEKIGEIKGKGYDSFIGVDIADINKNQKAEIFVTNFIDAGRNLNSFVLEWDGMKFTKISHRENFYFRIINVPGRGGNILCGQKKGVEEIFGVSGVYELKWNGKTYEQSEKLPLPKEINIFGFTLGDVLSNGQEQVLAFDAYDHIKLVGNDGQKIWRSNKPFGGSNIVLKSPDKDDPNDDNFLYLPQRIHIADLNNDGKNEIVVVNNKEYAGRFLSRVRSFKNGHIEGFDLDELGPTKKWQTREVTKFISDYIIADLNNNGHKELVYSVVTKTGSVLGKASSFIVTQDINQ